MANRQDSYDPDNPTTGADLQPWSFPTDQLLSSYVDSLDEHSEEQVRHLLRCLLFPPVTFGGDDQILRHVLEFGDLAGLRRLQSTEYRQRLLKRMTDWARAQPGLPWVLDLIPEFQRQAIAVFSAYKLAHGQYLPDGRLEGLSNTTTLIAARYMGRRGPDDVEVLREISPRELEQLVARINTGMRYRCELTTLRRVGGRDGIAHRDQHAVGSAG